MHTLDQKLWSTPKCHPHVVPPSLHAGGGCTTTASTANFSSQCVLQPLVTQPSLHPLPAGAGCEPSG